MTTTPVPLRLYDTLSRSVRIFEPLSAGGVRMYSCGPTVYSRAHLGNMRAYVSADTVRRALLWKGYQVRHVVNITDVGHLLADADLGDDKVEMAARAEHRTVLELTGHYTDLFRADTAQLGLLAAGVYPKATDYVPAMIEFAARLEEQGHAYRLPQGLYFDTSTIAGYGLMATMGHDTTSAEARIDAVHQKRHPADFALWRTFAPDEPAHAMEWDSPWGRGAPGWHLECSVMSIDTLGEHFDIHTGGVDHREVHHPNEDAQSRAWLADGQAWVGWWMHVEFVQFEGDKMSKSKGNVLDLDDVVALGVDPLAYKLLLLASHYRSQVTVGPVGIRAAGSRYRRLVDAVRRRLEPHGPVDPERPLFDAATLLDRVPAAAPSRRVVEQMDAAISDDLATPKVLAHLDEAIRDANLGPDDLAAAIEAVRSLLGVDLLAAAAATVEADHGLDATDLDAVQQLVAEREAARRDRDYSRADQLRDELIHRYQITVTDTPDGPTWQRRSATVL